MSITLLRAGILNMELVKIETIQRVVKEGLESFPDLEFPISEITKKTLPDILKLMEIQDLGGGIFVAILPLVRKDTFEIFSLNPLPMQVSPDIFMIADINNVILKNSREYIITTDEMIIQLSNNTYLLKSTQPLWRINTSTCEWEALQQNVTNLLNLCNFKRLGMTGGVFLAETKHDRLLYVLDKTLVRLNCPDGNLRVSMEGLHNIPSECDIETELVKWPARQQRHIDVKQLLGKLPHAFDITSLPIFTINESHKVHESIEELISKLPNNESAFTFDFEKYDWTLEEVQSHTIIAYGILSTLVIISTIFLLILYVGKCRKTLLKNGKTKKLKNTLNRKWHENNPLDSIRNSIRPRFQIPKDSLRKLRNSFRSRESRDVGTNTGTNHEIITIGEYGRHSKVPPKRREVPAPPLPMYR